MPETPMSGLAYHCPDCASTSQIVTVSPGVFVMQVAHDSTCPWLASKGGAS